MMNIDMIPPIPGTGLPRRMLAGLASGLALAPPAFAQEARAAIAKDAWIYAYAMLMSYGTMYRQTSVPGAPEYVGGFNTFRHYAQFFTPANHDVVTPNNDTPYSWAWLDLRAEPIALSVPAVEADRYYVCHYFDLFTHNFAIFGTRTTGREAANFLFVGPGWSGTVPTGIKQVFRPETQIIGTVTRTALHGPDDVPALRAIQAGYQLRPLSAFTGTAAPPPPPAVDWLPWDEQRALGPDFVAYLNLLLRFYPNIHPSETALFERFARIGIGGGRPFDLAALPIPQREAVTQGAMQGAAALRQAISTTSSSLGLFGTREDLGNDYMKRSVAAAMGLYGLSKEEAVYVGDDKDGDHQPLDGSRRYTLRFERGSLPPASIFWSATVYGLPDRFLVENPINRYSLGDRSGMKTAADGSTTIYVQATSPGPDHEANWLPVPASGGFNIVLRMYGPSAAVQAGQWHMPPITRVN